MPNQAISLMDILPVAWNPRSTLASNPSGWLPCPGTPLRSPCPPPARRLIQCARHLRADSFRSEEREHHRVLRLGRTQALQVFQLPAGLVLAKARPSGDHALIRSGQRNSCGGTARASVMMGSSLVEPPLTSRKMAAADPARKTTAATTSRTPKVMVVASAKVPSAPCCARIWMTRIAVAAINPRQTMMSHRAVFATAAIRAPSMLVSLAMHQPRNFAQEEHPLPVGAQVRRF
jgi:hypothetical protein